MNDLEGYRAKGKIRLEDLSGTSHIGCLNRKLQCQITAVVRVGQGNPQRSQDIFSQLNVAGRG